MVGGTIDFMPHAGDDHEPAVCNAGDKFLLGRGGYQTVQTGLKDKHRDLHLPGLGRRQGEFSGVEFIRPGRTHRRTENRKNEDAEDNKTERREEKGSEDSLRNGK